MNYPCSGCGACCRIIGKVKMFLSKEVFPYEVDEKGECENLMENNMCKIYETRPDICRIDKSCSEKDYPEMAIECNKLITEQNLDKKYLIVL